MGSFRRARTLGMSEVSSLLHRYVRERGRSGALRHEALDACTLRDATGWRDPDGIIVGVEVARDEAHLVLGRDAEVDGMIVRVLPVAREPEALARRDAQRLGVPLDGRMLPARRLDLLAEIVAGC